MSPEKFVGSMVRLLPGEFIVLHDKEKDQDKKLEGPVMITVEKLPEQGMISIQYEKNMYKIEASDIEEVVQYTKKK